MAHRYQVLNWHLSAQKPVIVTLPGGPGYGWTSSDDALTFAQQNGFPVDSPFLVVDPRGANCNDDPGLTIPAHTYRTRILALDVLQILRAEKISNYIVYGGSYGTVWATQLFDEIKKSHYPAPKFLVMDGVAGKYFPRLTGYDFAAQWNRRKFELKPGALALLSAARLPFGISGGPWAQYIQALLSRGEALEFGQSTPINFLKSRLDRLLGSDADRAQLQKDVMRFVRPTPKKADETSAEILAREIDRHELNLRSGSVELRNGNFKVSRTVRDDGFCRGAPLDQPYDSAKVKIDVPIVYMVGANDPQTPTWQANHHLKYQTAAPIRALLFSKTGGHWGAGRYFNDCAPQLWSHLLNQDWLNLGKGLQTCQVPALARIYR